MRIKIKKCTNPDNWYNDRVGETYELVSRDCAKRRFLVFSGLSADYFVSFDDCEILNVDTLRG